MATLAGRAGVARRVLLAFALLVGLQGCGGAGGGGAAGPAAAVEDRRNWSWGDDERPSWLPPPQERYPGYRVPDDGFRDHLARLAPESAAGEAAAPA